MNILFVHQNFPAQFGHIARHLIQTRGWSCHFVSQTPAGTVGGIEKIQYKLGGGARASTHYCSRTFENSIWHAHAVFEACKANPHLKPDLIVGHSGFGSTLFLPELYTGVPIINYFEYFYRPRGSDMDFRSDFPAPSELDFLRVRARNAMILLDLDNCSSGYVPTAYQHSLFPSEFQPKLDVIFDGIETDVYRRLEHTPRRVGNVSIPESTRVVTYVSRGFESMRGFDIFMKAARRIYQEYPDVVFVVVGDDRVCYGGDEKFLRGKSFREYVLAQEEFDLSKFLFTGLVPIGELVKILNLSDVHIYLTVPFVLSWSLMDALACECLVLASDTPPVREMINEGETGLLADFFDIDGFALRALQVLRNPEEYREIRSRAGRLIQQRYALAVTLPRLLALFEGTQSGSL
jgi:glycosyltransferase involved in cell wall biosynthesis